jgi:hypothetical protein
MDPILDENDKPIELGDLVKEASQQLLRERRVEASGLIKNLLVKSEQVTKDLKTKRLEVAKLEETLAYTLGKINRLKDGDWSVLKENKGTSKPDPTPKPVDDIE